MSEMIDRVAIAICTVDEQNGGLPWGGHSERAHAGYREQARAAIAAMREPTEAMESAGWRNRGTDLSWDVWRAMIDEALK